MDNWETTLIAYLASENNSGQQMEKAYICSPLHDSDPHILHDNMVKARLYAKYVFENMHMRPLCPQAWLPLLVNDYSEEERHRALGFGLELLASCDKVVVVGSRISSGMAAEIAHAKELNKEILYVNL